MKNIVHTIIRLRPDRLDIPLQKVTVGLFGSAHLMVVGIPEDVTETRISLTSPSDSAFEVDVGEGGKAYVEPGMLDLAGEGTYHVWATDAHGNPTPLGSGTLTVLPYPMSVPGSVRTAAIPVSSVMDENGTSRRLLAVKDQLGNWTLTVGDVVESSYKLVDPTKLPEDAADGDSMAVLKAKINAIKSAVKASCIAVAASLPLLCGAAILNEIPGTNEVYTAAETDARINDVVTNAVKDVVLLQETDPTVPAWAKSPNPPDFSVSNDTLVATIEAKAPAPDLSPSNATLVATIEATSPAPGNYATVSNRAMTALQEHQDISGKLDKSGDTMTGLLESSAPLGEAWEGFGVNGTIGYYGGIHWGVRIGTGANSDHPVIIGKQGNEIVVPSSSGTMALTSDIPSVGDYATVSNRAMTALQSYSETDPNVPGWAKSETQPLPPNYSTVSNKAMTALQSYTESDPSVHTWAKAATKPSYTASEVGATTTEEVYRLITGTNVVLIVTNYNSATHAPSMKLQHLDPESGQYVTYWDETRQHGITLTNAMDYTDAAIQTRAAPRAWSGTTSGLGSEAPAGVTWISTPETVIAGGYEYEKVITSAGAVWVLSSNGLTTGATTNSFFRISASDGTELFSIEKTDSYLIGVSADSITRSGNTVTIPVNIVAGTHPYIRATTNLVNAVWVKEDENGFSCPWATVSWSGTTGAYVATVTCSQPQAFFYFEYTVEGVAKIKNSAKTEMTGGIIFNGTTYMPTVNGNKLEFVAQ